MFALDFADQLGLWRLVPVLVSNHDGAFQDFLDVQLSDDRTCQIPSIAFPPSHKYPDIHTQSLAERMSSHPPSPP